MSRNMEASQEQKFRKCANIKSQKQRGSPCTLTATHGDFCSRHYKHPNRFLGVKSSKEEKIYTRTDHQAARQLQMFWRRWSALARYKRQGPASNELSISQNSTEVYSLEPLTTIPQVFFFSFTDEKKHIWAFDIRSLSHLLTEGNEALNPYTRERIPSSTILKINKRMIWLRKRRYPTLYATGENLTQEQIWNQKVLDVFFKMEALGYRASCRWFDSMERIDHEDFYQKLHRLWNITLHLTPAEKEAIVPGHASGEGTLFRVSPVRVQGHARDLRWWRRNNLNLMMTFMSRAPQKSQQALGALYILMILVQIVPEAAEAYPWILESVHV